MNAVVHPTRTARRFSGLLALCAFVGTAPSPHAAEGIVATSLAPHRAATGATLFQEVPPDTTGVRTENTYSDPEMWNRKYHEFEIGPIGTGVTIGDYDHDGRPDLFVVSKTESCRLFRNRGNWTFEDVTERAGVADKGDAARIWKQGATFADVNNDGRLDLYVCRFDAPNLLYLNQGDGTFKEAARAAGLDVKDASLMAAFADYDRDGWLDVFLQTNLLNNATNPGGQRDYLFRNNGNGTFTNVSERSGMERVETQGNSATWWDYNGDGWPDLYVANDFAQPDALYRNNRDGTFTNVIMDVAPHSPYSAMGSDIADVNNDGLIDFFVADMAATSHQKDQRTMADTRARTKDQPENATSILQTLYNALFVNTGTGRCLQAAHLAGLAATDWTWSPRFEDLDNDGRVDLHVTNGMHREIHNADLILRMMTAESAVERVRVARSSPVLVEPNLAFRNLGDLRFENVGAAWGLDQKGVSFGSAFGDLDGDGDLDLLYGNFLAGATLLRNDSDAGHRLVVELRGTLSNRFGIGSTVRLETASGVQVRYLTLARGYMSSSEPIAHFGLGADETVRRLTIIWPSGQVQSFDNLPSDHRYTITEPAAGALPVRDVAANLMPPSPPPLFEEISTAANLAHTSREEPVDELAQTRLLPVRFNRRGPALAVGPLAGPDGDDVLVAGTTRDPARLLVQKRGQPFSVSDALSRATNPSINDGPVVVFDANGDGYTDVLFTRGGVSQPAGAPEYQPLLALGDGVGGFRPAPPDMLPSLSICAGAVTVADVDRDGHLDVFLGARLTPGMYPMAAPSALWLYREGRFVDATDEVAPGLKEVGLVAGALGSDVDGDGWVDLLVAVEWGPVKYFHNAGGKRLEDRTDEAGFGSAGSGWWTSLNCADFNGDGRLDYVAGNVGLNTQFHADREHPAVLFFGDFRGDGVPQPIEAHYEGTKLVPWRARRDLGAVVPSVLKKYPRNDVFARASLEEILGADKLASAERFEATELRSGVFLSQPDGTFRFTPLPRIVQIAPLQGIATADFDGDGFADLYAAQNSYAAHPVTGRFDGGISQLVRGDGKGGFDAVPARESRLVVPGDAKAAVALDVDDNGWPDLLISRNHGATVAFRNLGRRSGHALAVRLRGPATNRMALGATVTAEHENGAKQVLEVSAGGGYHSQSSPARFFGSPETNPIAKVRVRWPNGATTSHVVDTPVSTLILEAP